MDAENTQEETYECPDCGTALPDEVGVQVCECGREIETFEVDPDFELWPDYPV